MDQLRALRVFERVVAEGSFAGAARAMDLTPPLVTRTLAELEQHLGARLLNRTTRRIALTEIGQAYLERARRVLAELDDADALAGATSRQPRGTLRVLCPPAFAVHQLAPQLPRFRARYPQLGLEISAPGAVEGADQGFDVSIVSVGLQPFAGDFIARPLARSTFVLCAAPDYLERRGHPRHPDDLLQHEALLPAVTAVRRELTLYRAGDRDADRDASVVTLPAPAAALCTGNIELLLAAALAGLGIAGLPSFAAAQALRAGRLARVLPQWRGTVLTIYAAMPTRKLVPARTRSFVDFLVAAFGGGEGDPWLGADA
jgi:DNA-binding transcriptional LysR family regulator